MSRTGKKANEQFLPFAQPLVEQEEIDGVIDTLKSGWLTTGPKVKRFEEAFAERIGVRHALAVNSCTAGLHLALEGLGIGKGDKVITTPYTFTASAEIVRYLGADIVLVDIDEDSFNIDPRGIKKALADHEEVKAIIPVHFAGQACEMDAILQLANQYNVRVVDDAAHALPTTYKGSTIGSLGDCSAFSFYATKTLATGEGGMVTTDNDDLAKRMRIMRLHGFNRDAFDRYTSDVPAWRYDVVEPGFKYNMSDVAAALGLAQLEKLEMMRDRRALIAGCYDQAFAALPLKRPLVVRPNDVHAWHLYVIRLDPERLSIGRDEFIRLMSKAGIGTSVHFIPLHLLTYWRQRYGFVDDDFPIANRSFQAAVSLPIYPKMSEADIERVIETVSTVLTSHLR